LAIQFPTKLVSWRNINSAKKILGFLLLFSIFMSVPYLTESDAIINKTMFTEDKLCLYSKFMANVWVHIESVYYIYIPIISIVICSSTTYRKMRSLLYVLRFDVPNAIVKMIQDKREKTVLLLGYSVTFIILHIPYLIIMGAEYIYPDKLSLFQEQPQHYSLYLLCTITGHTITNLQNSLNFLLLFIFWPKFRSTFRKMFCKCIAGEPEAQNASGIEMS
jgi:hypothetical protein